MADDFKLRSCQGITAEMAAELAEGIRQLAPDPDHEILANSPLCPVELEPAPWADPEHDVMADLREIGQLASGLPPRRRVELHCAPDVMRALQNGSDLGMRVDWSALLFGTPVIVEDDIEPGRWELREDGTVIGSGAIVGGA